MKLSIVILCWNDLQEIADCIRSIISGTHTIEFEIIVSDNGSTDGSVEFIGQNFPKVGVIENRANLGFAGGNNAGIRASTGDYVLILNPDTIVHEGSLDRWIEFAELHPEAGAFGCRVLNLDGSYQGAARPFPTVWREWVAALYLRPLAYLSKAFVSDTYTGWVGNTERAIDWQSGCCVMLRGDLLRRLGGFDERFFFYFEDVDLCRRVWTAGFSIIYTPEVSITHSGGRSANRFPIRVAIERERGRHRYFYKHFGRIGARRCRYATLAWFHLRRLGYGLLYWSHPTDALRNRLEMYRAVIYWIENLDAVKFVERGEEPELREGLAHAA